MNKKRTLFFLLLIVNLKVIAFSIYKGETFYKEVSPLYIMQQQDTTLQNRYLDLKKNIKNNESSKSLALSLILLDDSKKAGDKDLEFLSTYLIGDIFMKLNNHNNAIEYLNKSLTLLLNNNESYFSEEIKNYEVDFSKNKTLANNLLKLGTEYIRVNKADSAKYYFNKIADLKSRS